jgi:asparagine synthase (glutamine-hydrolysing)
MRKHGLLFPCNAHFHGPLLAAASTGSLLTGIGGDELFTTRPRAALVVAGTVRPRPRDILRLGLALAPPFARSAVLRRRDRTNLPWLTESADRAVSSAWSRFAATEPLRWRAHLSWCSRLRYLRLGARSLELLAADHDVLLVHPLTDPGFLGSCAHRPLARVDRAATMEALFGGLLPPEVLGRSTKASFDGAFFGSHSRAFASAWDGTGADRAHVDADWLRGSWLSGAPVAQTFTQLQAAWLASSGVERAEQLVDPALEAVPAGGTPVLPGR